MPQASSVILSTALQLGVGDRHLVEVHLPGLERGAAEHGFADGRRLLEDLLEHEVLVAGLLRRDRIPGDAGRLAFDGLAVERHERHPVRRHDRHFAVVEEHDIAGVAQDRRHVRGDKVFAVANADDNRRAVADGDELFRIVGREQHEREEPADAFHRTQHRLFEAVVPPFLLDEMRDDLGVGLRAERVALGDELALDLEIVFDDAVVDNDDTARAVAMRMRVLFSRAAMRGPSRMAKAIDADERLSLNGVFEVDQFARAAPHFDRAVLHDGDAGGVIAAILELAQSLDQDRHDWLRSNVADNSAH